MTALPRKEWSKARRRLVEITPNIDKIESALMHICLDQLVPETKGKKWYFKYTVKIKLTIFYLPSFF